MALCPALQGGVTIQENRASSLSSLTALFLLVGTLSSCGGGGTKKLTDYLSRVAAISSTGTEVVATQKPGKPNTGSGPVLRAASSGVVIAGGSKQIQISSDSSYGAAVVAVDGADGYYELTGLALGPGNTITVVVTIGQGAPQAFTLQVAGGAGSSYGGSQAIPVQLTNVGTGDVQVNVTWDVDSDVDLHMVEPSGAEIYYGNPGPSSTGGQLDLDSNAGCAIDGKRSENVTWPTGRAARGSYTVRVDYFSACGVSRTNYVVTINAKGQEPQVLNGSFVAGDADHGGAGAGRMIKTFTY